MTDALKTQVGGDHYKDLKIQPVEYIHANGLGYFEGNVVKYITRWREKDGVKDLEKIKHYVDLLIELEGLRPKAVIGGWVENTGKIPHLPKGTKVEIIRRDGIGAVYPVESIDWTIDDHHADIMQWRHAK